MAKSDTILVSSAASASTADLGFCSLKRKRPPRIEIPNVLREIPCPSSDRNDGVSCFTGSGFAVFSLKGKKKFMEDAHKAYRFPDADDEKKAFFGVYDGHGGSKAAEFVAENLHVKILEQISKNRSKEAAVTLGYLKTDEEFLKQGISSGACCVTALIHGRNSMVVSNLGDCRAVLCRNGAAEPLTSDHCPSRDDERRRIEDQGGYVEFHRGTWRTHGSLAVSRSIGDSHLKECGVIAEPDSKLVELNPETEYLVLASDGLWKQVSNQEAVDIVVKNSSKSSASTKSPKRVFRDSNEIISPCITKSQHHNHLSKENEERGDNGLLTSCKILADLAVTRGSFDDVTVMVVDLSHYRDTPNH